MTSDIAKGGPPSGGLSLADLSPAVAEALGHYAKAAEGAFSTNTERAIRNDLKVFATWCADNGRDILPATPDTVAAFADAMAVDRKPATISRYLSSIAHLHRAAGLEPPTSSETVRLAMKRIRRAKGVRQQQAVGLNRPHVDAMLDACGDTLADKRNRALLAVAYDTLARRSELVAIRIADLSLGDDGTVLIRHSKTDQEGEGSVRYLAPDTVHMVREWIEAAGIEDGALFRSIRKGGAVGEGLSASKTDPGAAVAVIFKKMAKKAGLNIDISGHSTRVGAAQDMAALGFGITETMQAGGWRSPEMIGRYTENQQAKRGAAAKLAAIQNRR